jgi:glycosyltransferase involved in cell wall biosynthesis
MKISVVTVSLNRGYEIEKTIVSVIEQTYSNFEYLIIDGGSEDNTIEVVEKYKERLDFVSEKDNGIYNAMNKGIKKATGDFLIFLNAGDYFASASSLEALAASCSNWDLVYGDILVNQNEIKAIKKYPNILDLEYFINDTLPHPGTLIRRSLFLKTGLFNEQNKIASDWEFFIKGILKFQASYKHIDTVITVFNADGISSLAENQELIRTEKEQVLAKSFNISSYKHHNKDRNRRTQNITMRYLGRKLKDLNLYKYLSSFLGNTR